MGKKIAKFLTIFPPSLRRPALRFRCSALSALSACPPRRSAAAELSAFTSDLSACPSLRSAAVDPPACPPLRSAAVDPPACPSLRSAAVDPPACPPLRSAAVNPPARGLSRFSLRFSLFSPPARPFSLSFPFLLALPSAVLLPFPLYGPSVPLPASPLPRFRFYSLPSRPSGRTDKKNAPKDVLASVFAGIKPRSFYREDRSFLRSDQKKLRLSRAFSLPQSGPPQVRPGPSGASDPAVLRDAPSGTGPEPAEAARSARADSSF